MCVFYECFCNNLSDTKNYGQFIFKGVQHLYNIDFFLGRKDKLAHLKGPTFTYASSFIVGLALVYPGVGLKRLCALAHRLELL